MSGANIAGMLFWLVISIYQMFGLKAENRKSLKRAKLLEQELNRLRNAAVEEVELPAIRTAKSK